ncbi:hypothetical protein EBQ91_06510 [bacterium]|nr:hypothetical protein [bacterium]
MQENKDIIQHIEVARYISDILKDVGLMSKASILYHPGFTGIKYSTVGEVVLVENIYKAFFHYCNFDNDLPIPDAYRAICPEKPTGGYDRDWTLLEKVEFLKLNGKQYRPENLEQLMIIVRNQNRIVIPTPATFTQMNALRDLLEGFQMRESIVVEGAFRQRLMALIDKYNPQQMVKEPAKNWTDSRIIWQKRMKKCIMKLWILWTSTEICRIRILIPSKIGYCLFFQFLIPCLPRTTIPPIHRLLRKGWNPRILILPHIKKYKI